MMDLVTIVVGVIVIAIVAYFILMAFMKKKKPKKVTQSCIDMNVLIEALGGKENIVSSTHSPSKLSVVLKDNHLTDIEKIKNLGASGIVEGKDSLSMIFGKASEAIDNDLKSML